MTNPPLPPGTVSPDGRFWFDGSQWQVVPLPPPGIDEGRRGVPRMLVWFLVRVAAVVIGGLIFIALITFGLGATNQLPH